MFAAVILLLSTSVSTTNAGSSDAFTTQKIVLQGDSGLYVSRIHRSGVQAIEVAKTNIDQYCVFEVIQSVIVSLHMHSKLTMGCT